MSGSWLRYKIGSCRISRFKLFAHREINNMHKFSCMRKAFYMHVTYTILIVHATCEGLILFPTPLYQLSYLCSINTLFLSPHQSFSLSEIYQSNPVGDNTTTFQATILQIQKLFPEFPTNKNFSNTKPQDRPNTEDHNLSNKSVQNLSLYQL